MNLVACNGWVQGSRRRSFSRPLDRTATKYAPYLRVNSSAVEAEYLCQALSMKLIAADIGKKDTKNGSSLCH